MAVEAIYAAAVSPLQWPYALQAIADCMDDVGSVLIYRRDDGSFGTIVSPQLEAPQRDYDQHEWWRNDIRFARYLERSYLANLDTVTERHVATADEINSHPFYTQFLAAHGLRWFAGTALSPEPRTAVALSVQRSQTKPAYSEAELGLVERIGRHVENALRLGIRLISAEMTNLALADALARVGVGIFLIDGLGQIVFSNSAAQRLIGDGLITTQERLTTRFAPERGALEAALATALDNGLEGMIDIPRPVLVRGIEPEHLLAVYVLPVRLPSGHAVEHLLASARALVLVTTSRAGEPTDPTIVRDLLRLTLGEARVAALIGAGMRPRDVAATLGITEETTRTTLKRVFEKVGVSRQSELAALLTRLVLR